MIDVSFIVYLGLLALMLALAVRLDFRRRARAVRQRRKSDLRAAIGENPPADRAPWKDPT